MERVEFSSAKLRGKFFKEVRENSRKTWKEITEELGTCRQNVDRYKSGKRLLPYDKFQILLSYISQNTQRKILKQIRIKEAGWGQRKAGLTTAKRHPWIIKKAQKAARISPRKNKNQIKKDIPLTENLCEFIGAIIGDGFINKYGRHYQSEITGDATLDIDYYNQKIIPILENEFGISPRLRKIDNTLRLRINSKSFVKLLHNRFEIPLGKKLNHLRIPKEILNSTLNLKLATVRGIMDTDGSVTFDKRKIYRTPYIRIQLNMTALGVLQQIRVILEEAKIPSKLNKGGLHINGPKNVRLYIESVGFSNPRHSRKVDYLIL